MARQLAIPIDALDKAIALLDRNYRFGWQMDNFVFVEFVEMLREKAEKEGWYLEVDE